MSRQLINEYRAELDRMKTISGSRRESVLREAFKDLLKRWSKSNDLQFVPEYDRITDKGNRIYLDGALLHGLRVPFGDTASFLQNGAKTSHNGQQYLTDQMERLKNMILAKMDLGVFNNV